MIICSRCDCNETDGHKKWCLSCLEAEKVFRQLRLIGHVKGKCNKCGSIVGGPKHICYSCSMAEQKYQELKRRTRLNGGMCTKCGQNTPKLTNKWCAPCLDAEAVYRNTLRASKRKIGLCIQCDSVASGIRCDRCRDAHNASKRQLWHRVKDLVFAKYGGYKCACVKCPEKSLDKSFFTIDHMNEDGNVHRSTINPTSKSPRSLTGMKYYKAILKADYKIDLQVLCWNCNLSKHRHNGICAHMLDLK